MDKSARDKRVLELFETFASASNIAYNHGKLVKIPGLTSDLGYFSGCCGSYTASLNLREYVLSEQLSFHKITGMAKNKKETTDFLEGIENKKTPEGVEILPEVIELSSDEKYPYTLVYWRTNP